MPIPVNYILGPGDQIKIILFGNNNKSYSLIVTRDGDIFIPDIGPVAVAGLSFNDMKVLVKNIVDNKLIGTQVSITLGALRSISVFVLGEAAEPGVYQVGGLAKLTNAIFTAYNIFIKSTPSCKVSNIILDFFFSSNDTLIGAGLWNNGYWYIPLKIFLILTTDVSNACWNTLLS